MTYYTLELALYSHAEPTEGKYASRDEINDMTIRIDGPATAEELFFAAARLLLTYGRDVQGAVLSPDMEPV